MSWEYRVDEVIPDVEGVWSEQGISAAVEFLLPRTLLHLPVLNWRKEHCSGQRRLLCYDYRLSTRSLDRSTACGRNTGTVPGTCAELDSVGDLGFMLWHLVSSMISFVQG